MKRYFLFFTFLGVALFLHQSCFSEEVCVSNPSACNYATEYECQRDSHCMWNGSCVNIPCNVNCCEYCWEDQPDNCRECAEGYSKTHNGTCRNKDLIIPCLIIPYCETCYDNEHCDQCAAYHDTNIAGTACLCSIPFCTGCNEAGVCEGCISGYHLSEDNKSCIRDEGPSSAMANVTTLVKITDECGEQ